MAADFSIGWDFGSIGGALWLRHKVVSGGAHSGTWLPEGEAFALDIRLDGGVWLELLAPALRATVNGEALEGPRRLRRTDEVVISDGQRSQRLTLRGLRADDTVPPGVLHVEGDAPAAAAARGAKAAAWLRDLRGPTPVLQLAERWRVRGLQRAAAWLTGQGVTEAAAIATSPRRPAVERAVTALLSAEPPRVPWADALAAFLGPEGRLLSEGLSISAVAHGPNVFVDPGRGPDPQAAALEHAALIARDVLRWLAAFDPALAHAEAADMEADAAVSSDDAQDDAQALARLLAPEGAATHRGSLVPPATDGEWASDVEVIEGDLVLQGAEVERAAFPALKAVQGALVVEACPRLVHLDLPALVAAGSVKVASNPLLVALDLPSLQAADGDVVVEGNRFLMRLSLPALERARTVQVLYDDALPRSEVTPLVERLGPAMVVHRANPDTPRDALKALLGGAWVREAERAKLRLVAPWFPEHPEVAELTLFDALLSGVDGDALEAHLARVIALNAGRPVDRSTRLLRQALRGARPLRGERERLAAATPAPDAERRWGALAARLASSPRRDALVDAFLRRVVGVHLVDALPPSLAAGGAWLEARAACDHEPQAFAQRLTRVVSSAEPVSRLGSILSGDLFSVGWHLATWARQHGRGDVLGREVALLEAQLEADAPPDDEAPSSLLRTWLEHDAQRKAAAAQQARVRADAFEQAIAPALALAAKSLDAAALASLTAVIHGPLRARLDGARPTAAEYREQDGLRWFRLRFTRRRAELAAWRDDAFHACTPFEFLALGFPSPARVQALYLEAFDGLACGQDAIASLVAREPSLAPALEAWRPPWRDDDGAVHFFGVREQRVVEVVVTPRGGLTFKAGWAAPAPPDPPAECWEE